jgi:glycogen operon protein
MILMGDEVRRSQCGNNNAYCNDDDTNWFDWKLLTRHADVHRFLKILAGRRVLRDTSAEHQRVTLNDLLRRASITWHGVKLSQPDWSPTSHSLAFGADLHGAGLTLHFIVNAYWEALEFELPLAGQHWRRWIDTSLDSPHDIVPWQDAPAHERPVYPVGGRAVVVLFRN